MRLKKEARQVNQNIKEEGWTTCLKYTGKKIAIVGICKLDDIVTMLHLVDTLAHALCCRRGLPAQ